MDTDVVIVGSGPGASVSAKNLSEAGHRVLVCERNYYFDPSMFPMKQQAAANYMFDSGGITLSEDGGAGVISGSTFGGGGTINWSVCFRLQPFVRQEWADEGLPMFATAEFDRCMDRIWDFVGAGRDGIRQNHRNQILLDGTEKLRWHGDVVDQNTSNREHYCGQCHLGCGSAEKRGPTTAWLPAAAEAGCRFIEGFVVDRVLFAADGVTATGVEGTWTSRDSDGGVHTPVSTRVQRTVVIKAKKVIVSGGSLWSPILLMQSGIKVRLTYPPLSACHCNGAELTYTEPSCRTQPSHPPRQPRHGNVEGRRSPLGGRHHHELLQGV